MAVAIEGRFKRIARVGAGEPAPTQIEPLLAPILRAVALVEGLGSAKMPSWGGDTAGVEPARPQGGGHF